MSRFTSHLGVRLLEFANGRPVTRNGLTLWHLTEPLVWERGELGSGERIIVPAFDPSALTDEQLRKIRCRGVTDFGSIPRPVRGLIDPQGPEAKAFVLHDDGYVTRGWDGATDRKGVDAEMMDALKAVGSPWLKRQVIHGVVRVGGGIGWGL